MFKEIITIFNELVADNSSTGKIAILQRERDNELLKKVLTYTYEKRWVYNVTRKKVEASKPKQTGGFLDVIKPKDNPQVWDIFHLLDQLRDRVITGNKAMDHVTSCLSEVDENTKSVLLKILGRDIQCRVSRKTVLKVWENLVLDFSVAKGKTLTYERDFEDKVVLTNCPDLQKYRYWKSRKLDGVRCVVDVEEGKASAYSTEGLEFHTVDRLLKEAEDLIPFVGSDFIIEGELCKIDEHGNENFQGLMSELGRKDYQIEHPVLLVIDLLDRDTFYNKTGEDLLEARYDSIIALFSEIRKAETFKCFQYIQQELVTCPTQLARDFEEALDLGWEGLIIRKNAKYKGTKSTDIYKLKGKEDAEFEVMNVEVGENDDGYGGKYQGLARVTIMYKDNEVGVGTGFSREQRIRYMNHPDEILGKIITVEYMGVSTNKKTGKKSLRHTRVKWNHGDRRTT